MRTGRGFVCDILVNGNGTISPASKVIPDFVIFTIP
jgi:hypothetical protein